MSITIHNDVLVEQARKGCNRSITRLWNRSKPLAMRIARRYAIDPNETEIIANEALAKAILNLSKWKGSGKFDAWMSMIVRNESINQVRLSLKSKNEVDAESCTIGELQIIPDSYELDIIHNFIESLPPGQQHIFKLIAVDGLKQSEVCDRLGMTSVAVRSAYGKARKKLIIMCKAEGLR